LIDEISVSFKVERDELGDIDLVFNNQNLFHDASQ
jgi:hypothetical protein